MVVEEDDEASKDGHDDDGTESQELSPDVVLPNLPEGHVDRCYVCPRRSFSVSVVCCVRFTGCLLSPLGVCVSARLTVARLTVATATHAAFMPVVTGSVCLPAQLFPEE